MSRMDRHGLRQIGYSFPNSKDIFSVTKSISHKSKDTSFSNTCDRCGKVSGILIRSIKLSKFVCERCNMEASPAKIFVGLQPHNNLLYFNTISRVLYHIDLKDIIKCGWFLRKWKIFPPEEKRQFKEEYTLEYYGSFKCPLAGKYLWPYSMVDCQNHACEITNLR